MNHVNSKYAIKTALAGTFTTATFMYAHYKNPQWAVLTTLLTMQSCRDTQTFVSTLIAGFNRIAGAAVGIAIGLSGYWAMNAVASDGFLWLILFVVFFTLWLAVIMNQRFKSLQLIPACTIIIMTMSLVDSATSVAYDRAFEVFTGVIIALAFNFLFCPFKQTQQLDTSLDRLIAQCQAYFKNSLSKISAISITDSKPNQKDIKSSWQEVHAIKTQKMRLFTDTSLLTQQESIHLLTENLITGLFLLNRYSNQVRANTLDTKIQKLINDKVETINQLFEQLQSKELSQQDVTQAAMTQRYPNEHVAIILVLHHLDELIGTLLKLQAIRQTQ